MCPQGVDAAPFEKWVSSAPNLALAQPAAKPVAQANAGANMQVDDDIDTINARLRDAYESNEDAF